MMTQKEKILNTLTKAGTTFPGISVAQLAARTKLTKDNLYRRVSDLRTEGFKIYTNTRNVRGNRVSYYRLAV